MMTLVMYDRVTWASTRTALVMYDSVTWASTRTGHAGRDPAVLVSVCGGRAFRIDPQSPSHLSDRLVAKRSEIIKVRSTGEGKAKVRVPKKRRELGFSFG